MGHETLENHLKTNFNLKADHGWSFTEIDEMVPWERQIYLELLTQKIRAEERERADLLRAQKRMTT